MGHFSIGKVFLVPSFDLEEKERRKIDRFLLFLDDSGVGDVVARYVRNGTEVLSIKWTWTGRY